MMMRFAGKFSRFYRVNGLLVTIQHIADRSHRSIYNSLLKLSIPCGEGLSVHPSSFIRGCHHIKIGNNFNAGKHLWLEAVTKNHGKSYNPRIVIGDNVSLNDSVHLAAIKSLEIGNNVLIASKVYISDHDHGVYTGDGQSVPDEAPCLRSVMGEPVIIEDNVWIGEFVSILKGVRIGFGSIIGSNSVVSRPVPPRSIAVGAPAKVIKQFDAATKQWIRV